jgi:hypothetical protein
MLLENSQTIHEFNLLYFYKIKIVTRKGDEHAL